MKKILFLSIMTLILSCNNKKEIKIIYDKYEYEAIQGHNEKAEAYLDEILILDKNNTKYLKLKIPFLINKCKKFEAIKLIDQVLEKDEYNIELNIMKILLLSENDSKRQLLIRKMELLLEKKIKTDSTKREQAILNLILIKKLQKTNEIELLNYFENFDLTDEDKNLLRQNIKLSKENISNIVPICN